MNNPFKYTDPSGYSWISDRWHWVIEHKVDILLSMLDPTYLAARLNTEKDRSTGESIDASLGNLLLFRLPSLLYNNSLFSDRNSSDSQSKQNWDGRIVHKDEEFYYNAVDGMIFPDGNVVSRDDFIFTFDDDYEANARWLGYDEDGKYKVNFDIEEFELTEANIRALVVHEAYGHGDMAYGDDQKTHHLAYFVSIDSKYWEGTTEQFKATNVNAMYSYYYDETKNKIMPNKYMNEFYDHQTNYEW